MRDSQPMLFQINDKKKEVVVWEQVDDGMGEVVKITEDNFGKITEITPKIETKERILLIIG